MMVLFTSCQFSENIYINEDGSGNMSFTFDASEMMDMVGNKMQEGDDPEKRIDSMLVFKDFLEEKKDSIAKLPKADRDKLMALKDFRMHMLMDPETKEMKFDLITDFKNTNELQNMFEAMNNASNLQGKGASKVNDPNNPFSAFADGGTTKMSYTFKNNTFTRRAKIIDEAAYKTMVDSIGEMAMMFGSSKYRLNYHFPRKIKSVSNKDAMFSADGKTLILEYGFMDYIADPKIFNLEVVLED
jgi:hypothetical protein